MNNNSNQTIQGSNILKTIIITCVSCVLVLIVLGLVLKPTSTFQRDSIIKQSNQNMTEPGTKEDFINFIKSKIETAKVQNPTNEFTFDEQTVVCIENKCKGELVVKDGSSKGTSKVSYSYIDGAWVNDQMVAMQAEKKRQEELYKKLGTENKYSLNVMTTEGVALEVFIDGESVADFNQPAMDTDSTISALLPLPKGKHEIEIRYSGKSDSWTYAYELKEYPHSVSSIDALSDDTYIIEKSSDDFGGFVKGKISGVKSIKLIVDAK